MMKLLLLLIAVFYVFLACDAFSFEVAAKGKECFYETVERGASIGTVFTVVAGGFLDIDVEITGPDRKVIYSGLRETDGRYSFNANTAGAYSFCFSNEMSTVTPKEVQLLVTVSYPYKDQINTDGEHATKEHVEPLQNSVQQLSDAIAAIASEQRYLKMREKAHRNTNESTNSRVKWWALTEVMVLVLMSMWQIYYLKRFFEDKRAI